MKIFSRYSVPPKVSVDTGSDSIVDKSACYDADINNIIKRYSSVDELERVAASNAVPLYGDYNIPYTVSDVFNLKRSLMDLYTALPSDVAKNYDNYNDFILSVGSMDDNQVSDFFRSVRSAQSVIDSASPLPPLDIASSKAESVATPVDS